MDAIKTKVSLMPGLVIGLLAFTSFVVVTTEFVVVGMLPEMAEALDISLAKAGWLVTWFALSAALFGPVLTVLAGRCNARRFVLVAMLVFVAGSLVVAMVSHYAVVIAVRIVQGSILPAVISLISVAAVRQVTSDRAGWAISQVNIGVVVATVFGIPMGAMVASESGWASSFFAIALLGFISIAALGFWFPDVKVEKESKPLAEFSLLVQPRFLFHLLLSGVLFTGMFSGYTYIASLLSTVAGLNGTETGWALMGLGIAGILGNSVAGRLTREGDALPTVAVAVALIGSMAMLVPVGQISLLLLSVVIALWGAAHMAAFVVTQVRVMNAGGAFKEFALSLNLSVCNLGIGLGAFLGGVVERQCGVVGVGYTGATLVTCALGALLILVRGWR